MIDTIILNVIIRFSSFATFDQNSFENLTVLQVITDNNSIFEFWNYYNNNIL